MDPRRVLSVVVGAVACSFCVLALALTPGFVVAGGADPAGLAKLAPALGAASGVAVRGYAFHRRPGTRNGLRWGLAQGGLMLLVILGLYALATVINPMVRSNPTLGGEAWVRFLAIALVLGSIANVLWERDGHRRRTAAVLLAAVCLIIVGLIGLRAGGPWILFGTPPLVIGIIGVFLAAVQGWSDLMDGAADPVS